MPLSAFRVVPLGKATEKLLLDFLKRDRILHIFTIYDLRNVRDKTEVWIAFEDEKIAGYLLEFNKKIIHTHGDAESVAKLLDCVDSDEPVFVIEPHHLASVKKLFRPIEPTDPSSKSKITTYLVVKTDADTFKPLIQHRVKKLGTELLGEVLESLGEKWKNRVESTLRKGMAFGAYEDDALASIATVSEIIDNIAFIRGVYTLPSLRERGLATSACSALVKELIELGKEPVLWVAKDNVPARRIYEKIGLTKTEHTLLGFKGKRL